jgi:hypothetical protein
MGFFKTTKKPKGKKPPLKGIGTIASAIQKSRKGRPSQQLAKSDRGSQSMRNMKMFAGGGDVLAGSTQNRRAMQGAVVAKSGVKKMMGGGMMAKSGVKKLGRGGKLKK